MTKRAAIYVRRSVADKDKRAASLETQEADCLARAQDLGYRPIVFTEERSASEYGNGRPIWDDLVRRLDQFDALIAWRQDRLARDELEWHKFVRAAGVAGTKVVTVADSTEIDPDDPDLLTPSVRAAVAAQESRNTSQRVRRGLAKVAAEGRPHGGRRRYGYDRAPDKTLVINGAEAAVIREAARRVIAGDSVRSIARDLREKGVPTVTGTRWSTTAVRGILTGPTVNGRRSETSEPRWEPILDDRTWASIRKRLATTPRGPVANRGRKLLRGYVHCGRCGARLVGARRPTGPDYICPQPDGGGCNRLRVTAIPLEKFIRDVVCTHAAVPQVRKALSAGSDERTIGKLSNRLAELERVADDIAAELGTGKRDRRAYRIAMDANDAERKVVERELHTVTAKASPILADAPRTEVALRRWWDGQDDDRRRALIDAVIDHIDIAPGRRGPNTFQHDRVSVVWRA